MTLDFSVPQVMAIVNITPDSFFGESRTFDADAVVRRVETALREGAAMFDIGGYSSRPGAGEVPEEEEWRRVAMGLEIVRRMAPQVPVSVDTFRSGIVGRVIERFGPVAVNDISAGALDERMLPTVARYGVPYIAMHMRGTPQTMQSMTGYRLGIVAETVDYFRRRISDMLQAGIRRENIVLDPGFGFAKTLEQNYELLAGLHRVCELGFPVLAGVSRKSMIWRALDATPADALAGTVALQWECLRQGAVVLRVHDVREAVDTVRLFEIYKRSSE